MTNETKHSNRIRRISSKAYMGVVISSTSAPPAVKGISYSKLLIFTMLILLSSILAAQTFVETKAAASPFELVKDWRILSVLFTMITIVFIALAYMFGDGFNIPELKAWAHAEIGQAIVTAIIVVSLSGVISFLDLFVSEAVSGSNLGFICTGTELCAITTANQYLDGMIGIAEGKSKEILQDSADASRTAALRFGIAAVPLIFPIPLLQMSVSGTATAGYLMDAERYNTALEQLANSLSSMYAQKYFISQISFKIAPILLVIGIVARSFFITRRLGGLLIAVGVGVMFVLPLMYVVDWITLNVALFGDSIITPSSAACPASCTIRAPKFYSGTMPIYDEKHLYEYLGYSEDPNGDGDLEDSTITPELRNLVGRIAQGEVASLTDPATGRVVASCEVAATDGSVKCPVECRELPYPLISTCKYIENTNEPEEGLPPNISIGAGPRTETVCNQMPDVCKIIRYVNPSDPYADDDYLDECSKECRTVPPLKSNCATGISGSCPAEKDYCKFSRKNNLDERPKGCHQTIGFPPTPPWCEASLTAEDSCVYVLPSLAKLRSTDCDKCLFVPEPYTFDPPIYRSCGELCNPSPSGPPKISPGEFVKRSMEGMVGRGEIKTVAALILPGYVLPLLNIVVTLMFIRSFSQLVGGDVEIPGMSKIL